MILDLSVPGLIAAVEAEIEAFPLPPNHVRYIVLVDAAGSETDIELRELHRRLVAGETFPDHDLYVTPGAYQVAS